MSLESKFIAGIINEALRANSTAPLGYDPYRTKEEMLAAANRIKSENPFKPGDWITPRKNAPIKGAGDPHYVVRTGAPATIDQTGTGWGKATDFDMIILWQSDDGSIMPCAQASWMFEPYTFPQVTTAEAGTATATEAA